MKRYNHREIEKRWQKRWADSKLYATPKKPGNKKAYVLDMFPYPSGAGLHVGHPEGYTATDIYTRYLRMNGYDVLHPMGWDAFGLPAENYAIKEKIHPAKSIAANIKRFRKQIQSLGLSYDWSREVNTAAPDYYKWTQWLFLKLYERGLAYRREAYVNWCPKDQTVLANEQVANGRCHRCGSVVVQKLLPQWFFKITDYADELLKGLEKIDWPEPIKLMQKNWIGKSEGAEIDFSIVGNHGSKNCLVAHGISGHKRENWFPWLKSILQKDGWNVVTPSLPTPDHPVIEEWNRSLVREFKANSVLVGHSLGAPAMLNLIQTAGKKISKLILVAPVNPEQNWTHLFATYPDVDWKSVKAFADIEFDWVKIKKLVGQIVIYYSDNDKYIPSSSIEYFKKHLPEAVFKFLPGKGHFNESSGIKEFPEILDDIEPKIRVFTTRPDTIFGATYVVLAPEHEIISNIKNQNAKLQFKIQNWGEVQEYIEQTKKKTELQRTTLEKEKTGVELKGIKAVNPATKEEIPIWIADYVLMNYGTGAIMAVPAHDERDYAFAKKYNLPIRQVVAPEFVSEDSPPQKSLPMVHRDALVCIVRNPKTNRYLLLKWRVAEKGRSFITGAAEKDEDQIQAAKREIVEETGYQDLHLVKILATRVDDIFFHPVKKENRYAHFTCLVFDLEDEEQTAVDKKELEIHEPEWITEQEVENFLQAEAFRFFWNEWRSGQEAFTGNGALINSEKFTGRDSTEAAREMAKRFGEPKIQYKLRDWLISRQRYWGAPIPIIYCEQCGMQPVPEKDLPVKLPGDVDFRPTGESPLTRSKSFHKVKCPKCKSPARRETDTMDTFVDSSWYWLRYTDPKNKKEFAAAKEIAKWCPVDLYVGGAEHAVLHLMYARFFCKALYDLGYLKFQEPFLKLKNQGLILGPDGQKMSKSRGNVINPDDIVDEFGADSMRMYEMFMGPLEDAKPWSIDGIRGVSRFLEKVWRLMENANLQFKIQSGTEAILHKTVKKVTEDIKSLKLNTAVSAMMILVNAFIDDAGTVSRKQLETFLLILAPFAPHLADELWQQLGHKKSIHLEKWPEYDKNLVKDEVVIFAVQINGKIRGTIQLAPNASEQEAKALAVKDKNIAKHLTGKKIVKVIYVPGKIINFVVS